MLLSAVIINLVCLAVSQPLGGDAVRRMEFINLTGKKVDIDWQDPSTNATYPLATSTPENQTISFNSFANHKFVIRTHVDENSTVHEVIVQVVEDQMDQKVVLKEGLDVERLLSDYGRMLYEEEDEANVSPISAKYIMGLTGSDSQKAAHKVLEKCRKEASLRLAMGLNMDKISESLSSCMEQQASTVLMDMDEKLSVQASVLKQISTLAENYTCADPHKETSEPIEERTWEYEGVSRHVGVLHNRPSSQIHVLHNFISTEECEAIRQAAEPTLHRGTVADGAGGSKLSENRKAWQAGVTYDAENPNDPILMVKKRLFAYANNVTGYGMELPGQEDLMSIQYFGSGVDNPTPDRYTPHCDGECNGFPHKKGGRVATMPPFSRTSTQQRGSPKKVSQRTPAALFFLGLKGLLCSGCE
ncbi:hypothetical protein FisN_9Lh264 [Fistulifera solaris]|uniref:SCP domain-containing protein n=1 Tax=Fistulifera solaris TaxID=1519565 RepID=A0A1Z5KKW5_FISSO|nr:hypothetical protein FisN_9Lh264 [Fistulifera solaris]|eukprot:GAX26960.1 hypothetical protein FisN_9Lh264 [Fistulifera solaris]